MAKQIHHEDTKNTKYFFFYFVPFVPFVVRRSVIVVL